MITASSEEFPSMIRMDCDVLDLAKMGYALLRGGQGGRDYLSNEMMDVAFRLHPASPFSPCGRIISDGVLYMAGDPGGQYTNVKVTRDQGLVVAASMNLSSPEVMNSMLKFLDVAGTAK